MTKFKIMVSCGNTIFEFIGDISSLDEDNVVVELENSSVSINRRFVAFIQTIEEIIPPPVKEEYIAPRKDAMKDFITSKLRHDPYEEAIVPPSQLPNNLSDNDEEARRIASRINNRPLPNNLAEVIQQSMTEEEFSTIGQGQTKYRSPFETIMNIGKNGKKD